MWLCKKVLKNIRVELLDQLDCNLQSVIAHDILLAWYNYTMNLEYLRISLYCKSFSVWIFSVIEATVCKLTATKKYFLGKQLWWSVFFVKSKFYTPCVFMGNFRNFFKTVIFQNTSASLSKQMYAQS